MVEKLYLHDANVNSMDVLVDAKIIRICVTRYSSASSHEQVESVIEFAGVQSFSAVVDFELMSSNAWAGNIEDWEPSLGLGMSHIYFVKGIVSIYSDEPVVTSGTPGRELRAK